MFELTPRQCAEALGRGERYLCMDQRIKLITSKNRLSSIEIQLFALLYATTEDFEVGSKETCLSCLPMIMIVLFASTKLTYKDCVKYHSASGAWRAKRRISSCFICLISWIVFAAL